MDEIRTEARAVADRLCTEHAPEATVKMRTLLAIAWLEGHEAGSKSTVAILRESMSDYLVTTPDVLVLDHDHADAEPGAA